MTIYPQLIIDALKTVRYPGNGKNLVEAEMIEDDIRIDGMKVSFSIIFPKATDPFRKSVMKAAEAAVKLYVSKECEVTVKEKVVEQPVEEERVLKNVKHIIAVSSGKGGVGKSTVTANLAIGLAKMGHRVGLLDCDIFGPSMPKMFQVEDARPYAENVNGKMFQVEDARPYAENVNGKDLIAPIEKYGVKLLSIGFFVDPAQATLWRGAMACNAIKQLIEEANWGELDYMILDTPPGTSDIHLTLIQTLQLTGAVIVSTPQEVALADARKGVNMYMNEKVNVPILGLVENMAWFTPAQHPDEKYYIFGKEGAKRLAEELNVPLLGQIPLIQDICEGCDNGLPAVLDPASPQGMALMSMAAKVVTRVDGLTQ